MSMRPLALLFLCRIALAAPTVYLSQRGECPDQATLLQALADHLINFDASPAPRPGARPVTVIDLGRRYRVIVDGEARDFEDPSRRCAERAATATVFIALALEPPTVTMPPPLPSPSASPAPQITPAPPVIPPPPPKKKTRRVETQFLFGTSLGIVFAGTSADVAYQADPANNRYARAQVGSSGAAAEPLHFGLMFGVRLHRLTALDLYARIGAPLVNNADSTQNPPLGGGQRRGLADFALILRDRVIFGDGRAHPFLTAGIGAGWIQHDLDLTGAQTDPVPLVDRTTARSYPTLPQSGEPINRVCPPSSCVDTVTMGYFLIQFSTGLQIDVLQGAKGDLGFLMELQLFDAPFQNTGIDFDFHLGLAAAF